MTQSILCCGGFHLDYVIRCLEPFCPDTSNPARALNFTGGVAGNVGRGLALLGHKVSLLSVVGNDSIGVELLDEAASLGIDTSLVQRMRRGATARYFATLDENGELMAGFADTQLYETVEPTCWDRALKNGSWDWCLVDANFSQQTMQHLVRALDTRTILGATVSVAKAARWQHLLDRLSILVTNRKELSALTNRPLEDMQSISEAGKALLGASLKTVIVTLGALGALLCTADSASHWSAVQTSIENVNGAGDAFVAGFLWSLAGTNDLEQCMRSGLAFASLVANTETPYLSVLDTQLFTQRRAQIRVDQLG
jgi:pseudouridine kinase